ncbi:MAG TPA: ATP-grasp domain-containing protein [Gemmatimonadales bacterium]|nr:ATP-grasp domain-containing protein [Gemmatimonadales bacterium]
MPRPDAPRLLLLLPTATYRTAAFVEAARRMDVALTVASERPSTFEAANPAGLLTLDLSSPERAVEQAAAFGREHPLQGVVGVDDDTAVVAAGIGTALGLRGHPLPAALAARDKREQRVMLAAAGVPVPRFAEHRIDEDPQLIAARAAYPCVLKPERLSASRGVIRANTPAQFVAAFQRLERILAQPDVASCGEPARRVLVEDFVPGPEVALEGLVVEGRLHALALFDKPDPLDGPFFEETIYVTPSRLPPAAQAAIAGCAQAAVAALGLREGPVHAELRFNDRGPWLIELAARPIGGRCGAALRFGNGVPLEEIIIRHALGLPIHSLEREHQASGVMMVPVPRAGVLREVRGVAAAKAVPLVEEVAITAHPGETLVPWPEGSRYPGFIFARGETAAAVEAALRAAHRQLQFVVEATD